MVDPLEEEVVVADKERRGSSSDVLARAHPLAISRVLRYQYLMQREPARRATNELSRSSPSPPTGDRIGTGGGRTGSLSFRECRIQ
jgi:hypothetical protein